MPIYAYRCETCGFTKDVLQKVSDAPLTVCPTCEKSTFKKQLTAAGFQLKGTGWYVTDFRNGSGGSGGTSAPAGNGAQTTDKASASSEGSSTTTTAAPASSDSTSAT